MPDETLAITPRFGSTAPVLSTMTSSANGYSLSLTTKGAIMMLSCWRSTSAGLMTYVPLIVKHFSAWRFQPQTLIARKVFASLKVPRNLMLTMSKHRHVLATTSAIKMTGFCRNIYGPSHKELSNITYSPSSLHLVRLLGTQPPPWLTSIALATNCVSGIAQPRKNTGWLLFHLLQSTQNVI